MGTTQAIELKNFSIGLPTIMSFGNGQEMVTGIGKKSIEEVFLTKEGFVGDGVANSRFHGGPDRAVCIYSYEHYFKWEQEFKISLPPAAFGENLTVTNMVEETVYIGDIYRIGDAVIQVTQGRIPCSTISKRTGIPTLLKRIVETGFTGFLCRVLEEGLVHKDSKITLLQPHPKQISIQFTNEIYFHKQRDTEGMRGILDVQELASA